MPHLTPREAAEVLGIADEHVEAFVRVVDALRTPDARGAEVDRLRADLTEAYANGKIGHDVFRRLHDHVVRLG